MGLDPSFWTDAHSFCRRCAAAGRFSAWQGDALAADKRCCQVAIQSNKRLPAVNGRSLLLFTTGCSSSSFIPVLPGPLMLLGARRQRQVGAAVVLAEAGTSEGA